MSVKVFCPFLDWVACFFVVACMSYLYVLEVKALLIASFANIFSYSIGCLFVLFMVSFAVEKLISLITSHVLFLLLGMIYLCQRVFCL